MEPLQKKCLFISAAAHAVLLGVLLVGSAFLKPPPPREIIPIKYFSGRLVDSVLNGGGGAPQMVRIPNPTPSPAPPAPQPRETPSPTPPQPTPPQPTPPKANPTPTTPRVEAQPKTTAKNTTPTTTSKNPRINTTLTTRKSTANTSTEKATPSASTRSSANPSAQKLQALERTMQSLNQGLTSGGLTISDVVGSGVGGGAGAVNYSQAVLGAYDDAWRPPAELEEDAAVAVARIVVHRTGRIVDARIIKRSGNHLMDLSVQNALEAVKELPPFPEGARDLERTFKIEFNLKVKRGLG